ncbi:MAG: leucine-rich repeat domain-containing protein [Candidatus Helarchaeota archaeon]
MGKKYSKVKPSQAKVLEELEKRIGKEIKHKKKIQWDIFGYRAEEQEVVELNLNFKEIKDLPESIGNLESLEKLFLHKNQLKTLPDSFGNLKSLKILALGENKLKKLPDSFSNLKSLKELWLNDNRLTELPTSFGKLKFLQDLNLEHNRLTSLPNSFGNLKNLISLDLSHNQLVTLPESFGKLKSLQILDLEHNKLEWLPESFGNLRALRKLDLSHNQLKMLPGFFGNLRALQTLDLQRNQLKTLPGYLWRLQNLFELRISGNPLGHEWNKVKNKGTEAILELCRKMGSVNVFISYAVADFESGKYPIAELADELKKQVDISYVYHCMQDMKKDGQIDKFMNQTIPQCQFIVFIATKRSLQSRDCQHELTLARTHHLKIIPILGDDLTWDAPQLKKLGLTREYGLTFKDRNVQKLSRELYDHIVHYKQKHEVFTKEEAELKAELLNIKRTIINFLESSDFEKILKRKREKFKDLFQALNSYKITPQEYFLKCAELISSKKKKT